MNLRDALVKSIKKNDKKAINLYLKLEQQLGFKEIIQELPGDISIFGYPDIYLDVLREAAKAKQQRKKG